MSTYRSVHAAPFFTALTEKARRLVAKRTRPALAAREVHGVKLGNPTSTLIAGANGRQAQITEANAFAGNVMPIVDSLRSVGVRDLRGLAAALNARGVRTARGGRWHVSSVKNVIDRSAR